ncbi:uncharacterized protein SOCE836_100700 [Sorangium cellulosum]|uniref:Uncharacterized protein n=1 Tax=Sorangium cellulosum TaxID=56 RepID=A0A4P2R427_SORCE|nr:uncharacterized protein SOCE836_100700 [Sorangium cellulosum]WCQ97126.1 hypothetical protein NQZ70_09917 [Sorangium sp. Soce836]
MLKMCERVSGLVAATAVTPQPACGNKVKECYRGPM